jgi:hypothetical protein
VTRSLLLAVALLAAAAAGAKDLAKPEAAPAAVQDILVEQIAGLAPQRPGHPDLFVLAVAGDGTEAVFRNEVLHLRELAAARLDAGGRTLVLANHAPQPPFPRLPLATRANIAAALAGIGAAMDPTEDLLLLYFTTHGTPEHELLLRRPDAPDRLLSAPQLRRALDASGIRFRVLALSACYSGGLLPPLRSPDTLILTAARRDRASFGCGNDSAATYFGRAWLVDGLNATVDFDAAFDLALTGIRAREELDALEPSLPQRYRGPGIAAALASWRASFTAGPALPYPYADTPSEDDTPGEAEVTVPLRRADSGSAP